MLFENLRYFFTTRRKNLLMLASALLSAIAIAGFFFKPKPTPNTRKYRVSLPASNSAHLHYELFRPKETYVEVSWPKQMVMNGSDSIIVALIQPPKERLSTTSEPSATAVPTIAITPSINRAGHESRISNPTTVPTPVKSNVDGWTVVEAYATNKVSASNFNVIPNTVELRPLNSERLEWRWNISPKQPGTQLVNASVELEFRAIPETKIKDEKERRFEMGPIWVDELPITVSSSWLASDSVSIGALVVGIIGFAGVLIASALALIPMILDRITQARERRKEKERKPIGFRSGDQK